MIVVRRLVDARLFAVLLMVVCAATAAFAVVEDPLQWEFRLSGGSTGLSGRVEMRPNATAPWGTICKDLFKENNFGAIAACNSAGLVGVTQALYKTTFGPGTGPIYLTDVACTASTTFIQNCSRSPLLQTGACVHFEDVGVECSPPESSWQFKMVNGTAPSNGLVLIQPMPGLPWGALSNAQFLGAGWRLNRRLLCKSLGYPNVTAPGSGNPMLSPYNADPFLARYVVFGACPTTAATIGACPYSNFGSVAFPSSTFLVLDCAPPPPALLPASVEVSLVNGVTPWSGAILIRPNASLPWGVIPQDEVTSVNWFTFPPQYSQPLTSAQQAVLNAVCHTAGFPAATKAIYGKYGMLTSVPAITGSGQSIVYYQAFNCSGAFNLTDCTAGPNAYTESGNAPSYYAGVDCFPSPPPYDQWECRLNTNGGTAANGTGYAEMRPNAGSPWLGVCGDGISAPFIDGFCRKLGFGGLGTASFSYSSLPLLGRTQYYIGFRPSCPRKVSPFWELPDNMSLENCTISPVGMQTCNANGDVKLNCLFPRIEEMTVRVSDGGGAPWRGRVEILPRAGYPWGTITDTTYGNMAEISNVYLAFAICRSIGFTGPNVTNPIINYGVFPLPPPSTPIYWRAVTCIANSVYLNNCTYGVSGIGEYGNAPHWFDLGVDCFPSPFEPRVVLEGAGAGVAGKGRVMMQYNPNIPLGSVCNDLFKHNHFAWNAACRSAGFLNVTRAAYQSFGPAAASAPIALDDVVCTEQNRFLQNCTHRPFGQNNCHHGEDAGVDCYPPPEVTTPWQFRLSDGTAATNGRVEMRPGPTFPWGSICAGPYFNHSVAAWEAACRSVGFTNVTRARWGYFGKGSDTVYLDNVSCNAVLGNLTTPTTLVDCDRFPLGSYRCSPSEVAGVDCNAPAEVPSQWQFRLVDGWTATSGRLEMRPDAATPWGGVCRHGLQHLEALRAVCRSTGHAAATRPVLYRPLGSVRAMSPSQPFYLDDATCNASTPFLHNCSYAPLYSHDCDPLLDALFIECMPTITAAPTVTPNTTSHSPTATVSTPPPTPSATLSRTVPRTGTGTAPRTPTGGWPKAAVTVTANTSTTATTTATATAALPSPSASGVSTLSASLFASDSGPPRTHSRGPVSVSGTAQGTPSNGLSATPEVHATSTARLTSSPRLSLSANATITAPPLRATFTATDPIRTATATVPMMRSVTAALHRSPTRSLTVHRSSRTSTVSHHSTTQTPRPTAVTENNTTENTTTEPSSATNGSAPCPLGTSSKVETGTTLVAVRGPHILDLPLPAPVLVTSTSTTPEDLVFAVPLPPQLPPGALALDAGMTCRAAAAGVLRCELTILDEKAVTAAVTITFALLPRLLVPGCAGHADVRVSVTLLPIPNDASLAVVALLTAAAGTTRLVFLADPTAFDSMAVVVALISRCASATDAAMARWARYLLSPLIDLGPSVVGLVHTLVPVGVVLLHAAAVVVSARLRRSFARHVHQFDLEDRDGLLADTLADVASTPTTTAATAPLPTVIAKTSTLSMASAAARWRFPGASMAVAVLLYPGAAWALATHIGHVSSDRNGSAPASVAGQIALLCAFLVAVPVVSSFCLIRIDVHSAFHAFPFPVPQAQPLTSTADRLRAGLRWACCPRGVWGPEASRRCFGPLHGTTIGRRPAARWALLAGACTVLLLVCALIGAPTRADTCRGLHATAAIIVFVGTAALVAFSTLVSRSCGDFFATPLTAALTVAGGLSLGAVLAAQAANSTDSGVGVKAAAVVINAAVGILRSLHIAGTWWWLASSAETTTK